MHIPHDFAETVTKFLVPYYLVLAVMNGVAAYYLWQKSEPITYFRIGSWRFTNALLWCLVAIGYVLLASLAAGANLDSMPRMPLWFREFVNRNTGPVVYSVGTTVVLAVLYIFRAWFVKPVVAWTIWNLMFLFLGLSMPDYPFYTIVAKPDNVPIVGLVKRSSPSGPLVLSIG